MEMNNEENVYCRLCAKQFAADKLISPVDDVDMNKLVTKLLTINIDLHDPSFLPKTVCLCCFEQLEKTFLFINEARDAQRKLLDIFAVDKPGDECRIQDQTTLDVKVEEEGVNNNLNEIDVKLEPVNDNVPFDQLYDTVLDFDYDSTDSDAPLLVAFKRKKTRKKGNAYKLKALETSITGKSLINSISWEDIMYRCGLCDALCKNITSLRLHSFEIHKSCCIFRCIDCTKILPNYILFVSHMRKHQESLKLYCEYCNKHFGTSVHTKKHLREKHESPKCLICGLTFDTDKALNNHISSYSQAYKRLQKTSKLKSNLTCDICSKKFKTQNSFSQHKLVHTQRTRDYTCHICGKMFYTKGTLSTHILVHQDEKRYKCDFCPLVFRARGNLQNHVSLHSGVKPFVCEQCGKSFRVKRQLKSHSIMHTDLMPYVCGYCQKSFRFKTRLNLHLRQHTGAKPYKCIYCQRDFTNGSNYKKHMKRRHNIDTSVRQKYAVGETDIATEEKISIDNDGVVSVTKNDNY